MSPTRREFLGLAAAAALFPSACSRKTASTWEARVNALETHIRQSMEKLQVPGVSVALIREASLAWTGHFGVRDRTTGVRVDDETVFSAQSMSKPVFAYRVMKLAELGVIDLDAPLTRYTPDVFVANDPRLNEITARRVLSHTTGLPNWRSKEEPLRIAFTPGSKWSYSGEGYHYLQTVVSRLTGHTDATRCGTFELDYRTCATDFGEYMTANLLKPFGMSHSGYVLAPAMERALATPHDKAGAPMPQKPATALDVARYGSAGSLMTTASDFARFLIEVMSAKPADDYRLGEASRMQMLTPQVEVPDSPIKMSWALGWQVWTVDGGEVVAHGGDIDGWHSQSAFSRGRKTGFVILTNGEGGASLIWNELLKPLIADFVIA